MKTLFIVGPTATGKTELALSLASLMLGFPHVAGVDILSADSKQVYIGQDIVTGKDKEKFLGLHPRIHAFGVDVVNPNEEWSVAHFMKYASTVFAKAREQNRVVIVVGGSGLYASSLTTSPETVSIPPDEDLRKELDKLSVKQLQRGLLLFDPDRHDSMNESDIQNPRRLVRAIEVAVGRTKFPLTNKHDALIMSEDILCLGLECAKPELQRRISDRVQLRLELGAIEEAKTLRSSYGDTWKSEARAAIGYEEIEEFLAEKITREQLMSLWTMHEVQYAKRQEVWFRKMENIHWLDIQEENFKENVVKSVEDWYTESHGNN